MTSRTRMSHQTVVGGVRLAAVEDSGLDYLGGVDLDWDWHSRT